MGSKSRKRRQHPRREHAPAPTALANAVVDGKGEGQDQAPDHEQTPPKTVNPTGEDATSAEERVAEATSADDAEYIEEKTPLPMEEAKQVLERFFVALLAASISPMAALKSLPSRQVTMDEFQSHFYSQLKGKVELQLLQLRALRAFGHSESDRVDIGSLTDLASAATFRVEALEFQIRQALMDRAGGKSRGKVDIQRFLAKVASSFPEEMTVITPKDLGFILEEKLGVNSISALLLRIIFGRVTGHSFTSTVPTEMQFPKSTFFAYFEAFIQDRPLSVDSVEGQLRQLLNKHPDLRASFKSIDADNSGSITLDEFVSYLQQEACMLYPRGVLAAFIRRFDTDGDGTLSYEEFVEFISPKVFGIHVLTPFGMFYQACDRHEPMGEVVAKIKTRMFWMQHNDLFATSTQPTRKAPLKLKVTEQFILTHCYGSVRLQYKNDDPIAKVLTNGEMVVMILDPRPTAAKQDDEALPPFEYRLKSKVKRTIPPLMFWTLRQQKEQGVAPSTTQTAGAATSSARQRAYSRRASAVSSATSPDGECASVTSTTTAKSNRVPQRKSQPTRRESSRTGLSAKLNTVSLTQPLTKRDTERIHPKRVPTKTQSGVSSGLVEASSPNSEATSDLSPASFEMCHENNEEGGAHDDDYVFHTFVDDDTGDESIPHSLCVEDSSVVCDEDEPPPPPYYA